MSRTPSSEHKSVKDLHHGSKFGWLLHGASLDPLLRPRRLCQAGRPPPAGLFFVQAEELDLVRRGSWRVVLLVPLLSGPGHLQSPWGGMVLHLGQGHRDGHPLMSQPSAEPSLSPPHRGSRSVFDHVKSISVVEWLYYSKRIFFDREADLSDLCSLIFVVKMCVFVSRPMKLVTFLWKKVRPQNGLLIVLGKETHSETKSWKSSTISTKQNYNNNGKPWKSSRILRVQPNFLFFHCSSFFVICSFFFVYFSFF